MNEEDVLSVDIEADVYLLEQRIAREENFDILEWWNESSSRYKVLSKIVRDILVILISSTVASKSAF